MYNDCLKSEIVKEVEEERASSIGSAVKKLFLIIIPLVI